MIKSIRWYVLNVLLSTPKLFISRSYNSATTTTTKKEGSWVYIIYIYLYICDERLSVIFIGCGVDGWCANVRTNIYGNFTPVDATLKKIAMDNTSPVPKTAIPSCFATPIITSMFLNEAASRRTSAGPNGQVSLTTIFDPVQGELQFLPIVRYWNKGKS